MSLILAYKAASYFFALFAIVLVHLGQKRIAEAENQARNAMIALCHCIPAAKMLADIVAHVEAGEGRTTVVSFSDENIAAIWDARVAIENLAEGNPQAHFPLVSA